MDADALQAGMGGGGGYNSDASEVDHTTRLEGERAVAKVCTRVRVRCREWAADPTV